MTLMFSIWLVMYDMLVELVGFDDKFDMTLGTMTYFSVLLGFMMILVYMIFVLVLLVRSYLSIPFP